MWFDTGRVTAGPFYLRVVDRGNEVDIELPEEGDVSYYRFEEDEFLHRDPLDRCADGPAVVVARDQVVVTHMGSYSDCVELFFKNSRHCSDGGLTSQWWCPELGLASWTEKSQPGTKTWRLLEFERNLPRFVRGDIQGDGMVDIGDPIALLGYLFLGTETPPCLDAADTDDSGELELSDAVFLLSWLFSGGSAPPEPAPTAAGPYAVADCGADGTTLDELGCEDPRCDEAP